MATIIKLLIVAAVLNAVFRGGVAAADYYQLKDAAQQIVIFAGDASTSELHNRILEKAAELEVPLAPENVDVRRDGPRTRAQADYTQPVEFFPNYSYPVPFSFSVEGFSVSATRADDVVP